MAYCELTTLDKEFLRSLIDNQTGKICDSIRTLRATIEEQHRIFGGSTYADDCKNEKPMQESIGVHNSTVHENAKGMLKQTEKIYNREQTAYIEFDASNRLRNFINDVKDLYDISCIRVRLYDIIDVLKHYSEIKEERCKRHVLNFDLKNGNENSKPFVANVSINVYDYRTWKLFEKFVVVKTAKLVDETSSNKTVYEINTGLKWTDDNNVILQIFVFFDEETTLDNDKPSVN